MRFQSATTAAVSPKAVAALSKPQAKPEYAAGGKKMPIMFASVKVP